MHPRRVRTFAMNTKLFKIAAFILLSYAFISLPFIFLGEDNYPRIGHLEQQLEKMKLDNRKTGWQIKEMQKLITDLRSNPVFIKRVARQEFGYVSENEVIFIIE